MTRNPELTGTLPLAPIRRLPKRGIKAPRPPEPKSPMSASKTCGSVRLTHMRKEARPKILLLQTVAVLERAPNWYCRGRSRSVLELVRFAALDSDDGSA